jgi:hypothetical protein
MIPKDKELYEEVKKYADKIYSHPSAYKSGFIIKEYKRRNGEFINDNSKKPLKRWFRERWRDYGHKDYPVYRPTIRISSETPLTVDEIDKKNLEEQIKEKQKIRGFRNLQPFKRKNFN